MTMDNFTIQSASTQGRLMYVIAEAGTNQNKMQISLRKTLEKNLVNSVNRINLVNLVILNCWEYPTPKPTDAAVSWQDDILFLPIYNGAPKSLFIICELGVVA